MRGRSDLIGSAVMAIAFLSVAVWVGLRILNQGSTGVASVEPGVSFYDCEHCPEMIGIPGGSFTMGSTPENSASRANEVPAHEVTVGRFAVGRYEVSVGEFRAFVDSTEVEIPSGCLVVTREGWFNVAERGWEAPGFAQGGKHPVTCVAWDVATQYVSWLSQQTGLQYRLPTEAEWEYLAWAEQNSGHPADTSSGAAPCKYGNVHDNVFECRDGFANGAAPGGSYPAGAFGLYDLLGNVREWTADCWHETYDGAPDDGSTWATEAQCTTRVSRGGYWLSGKVEVRPTNRLQLSAGPSSFAFQGFRVARSPVASDVGSEVEGNR